MLKLLRFIALSLGALTVAIPLVLLGLWLLSACVTTYQFHFGFDQGEWLAIGQAVTGPHESGVVNARKPMLPDLLAHHLRLGMSLTDTRKLLGPPERVYPQFDSTTTDSPTAWPPVVLEYRVYQEVSSEAFLDVKFVNDKLVGTWETTP